jgi:hypothetical protein
MNVPTGLPCIFNPLGDDQDGEDDDNFTDDCADDSQDKELTDMWVISQHII